MIAVGVVVNTWVWDGDREGGDEVIEVFVSSLLLSCLCISKVGTGVGVTEDVTSDIKVVVVVVVVVVGDIDGKDV